MSFVPHEINLLVSSDPASGASNVSADGSRFEVALDEPITIPPEAVNVTISVEEATVWWVVPNIITGQNDRFYITAPRALDDALTAYVLIIPQGLYDLSALNQSLARELEIQGAKVDPEPVLELSPDNATQLVELRLRYIGSSVDFTQPDTPRIILGFDSQVIGPTLVAPTVVLADNIAEFNQVNYFLIHSDLVSQGIRFNNQYNQTIAQVLIDVPPGSQIVSNPRNPAKSNASELVGSSRKSVRMWLTDDSQRQINTNGEYWTARIVIKYLIPHMLRHGDGAII